METPIVEEKIVRKKPDPLTFLLAVLASKRPKKIVKTETPIT